MKKFEDSGLLLARVLMTILFITAGWGKITGYAGTAQYMQSMGVPGFLLPHTLLQMKLPLSWFFTSPSLFIFLIQHMAPIFLPLFSVCRHLNSQSFTPTCHGWTSFH